MGRSKPKVHRGRAVERFLQLRPVVLAQMRASVPAELRAKYDAVTLHQLQALVQLPEAGLLMNELAAALGVSGATASALADRLVAKQLVERDRDPGDRRVVRLVLSAAGRSLVREHQHAQRRSVTALLDRLADSQVAAMLDAMETLAAETLDADPHDSAATAVADRDPAMSR